MSYPYLTVSDFMENSIILNGLATKHSSEFLNDFIKLIKRWIFVVLYLLFMDIDIE